MKRKTHGLSGHILYAKWVNMMHRCYSKNNKRYFDWGGRGITVCDKWHNVANFIEDMYPSYINGLTLDRKDNDKGYSKDNCRWVDKSTQVINQRIRRTNTSGYVGVTWAKNKGMWSARVQIFKRGKHIGYYLSKEEAVQARDNYIIENNLPHKLSIDYIKEIK